jgi:endonuclease YncB( thermonuclease family)
MGLLTVTATLDIRQIWPDGSSDADTLRVKLSGATPFKFTAQPGGSAQTTNAFAGAFVRVKGRKELVITKDGSLRVRLQCIDAPELHYRPVSRLKELRQHHAETAATALAGHLRDTFGNKDVLECATITQVNEPAEVFDMYARFIGDVVVTEGGANLNVNQWLVEQGWALPSFYNSMTHEEIQVLTDLTERARDARRGVWAHNGYTSKIGVLDRALTYRKPGSAPANDAGPVILPKLFRRQYMWADDVDQGESTATSLKDYLLEPSPSKRDKFVDARKFLADRANAPVKDLAAAIRSDARLGLRPERIVFLEAEATLFGSNGKSVRNW